MGLCWNLRLVIELWYLEGFWFLLKDFFWGLYFGMVKYLNFHNSSFTLIYFWCKWQGHGVTHPLFLWGQQLSPYSTHTLVTHTHVRTNGFVTPNTLYNSQAQVPLCQKINKSRTKLNYSNLPSEIKKGNATQIEPHTIAPLKKTISYKPIGHVLQNLKQPPLCNSLSSPSWKIADLGNPAFIQVQ